jgi:dolichol-phosphate mannosyltransferase
MLVMDGDHTYDPKDIQKMLLHADKYDEIIGVRTNAESFPKLHRLGNKIINYVLNLLLGTGLSDVCSGMYLLRTETAKGLDLKSKGFGAEVEIAINMSTLGKVTEVPISYRKRLGNRKLRTWREGFKILTLTIGLVRAHNPVFLLATLTSLLAIPGVAIMLWQLFLRYLYGAEIWSIGMVWLGLFLLILGVQGFTIATIALLLKRMEQRIFRARKG